jgi:hypothetical protein
MIVQPEVVEPGISVTRLAGIVTDQAALHGILNKLYNLGLP